MIKVYRATHSDLNDGSRSYFVGYFTNSDDAHKSVDNLFIQGCKHAPAGSVDEIEVFESIEEFERHKQAKRSQYQLTKR